MRLLITTSDGGDFEVADFDAESALDLKRDLNDSDDRFLTLDMDDGTVELNRDHIVSVQFD